LSDSQLTTIMAAARPLSTDDRDAFLQQVASVLAREPELGDGVVARVCREAFKQRRAPPEIDGRNHGGKYGR
jgi:hypothetical protein